MSVALRVLLIAISVGSLFYIIRKIRYSKMQIEYTLFWIVLSIVFIIMAIFPEIVYFVMQKMGMISAANVVYLFIISVLLLKVFMMTIEISSLETKMKELAQQVGLNEKSREDDIEREKNEEKS